MRIISWSILFLSLILAAPAHAACTNPTADPGKIIFNADYDVFQGCTSAGWVAFHAPTSGGSGPTDCPNVGDVCDDGSYFIGQVGGNEIFATASASESSQTWNNGTSKLDDNRPYQHDGRPG